MSLTNVLYKHPVQSLDQHCQCKRMRLSSGMRVTWRLMFEKARAEHEAGQSSSLLGYIRWLLKNKVAGPCVGANDETVEAFKWASAHEPYWDREPEDWRGDCDYQDGVDAFWDEAARNGMNPFWGM